MNNKNNNKTIIVRYFLGLGIIVTMELIAIFIHHSPMLPLWGMVVMPVLIPLFLPPLLIGIYIMFSSKTRWRLDLTLLIIAIICLVVFASVRFGNL